MRAHVSHTLPMGLYATISKIGQAEDWIERPHKVRNSHNVYLFRSSSSMIRFYPIHQLLPEAMVFIVGEMGKKPG